MLTTDDYDTLDDAADTLRFVHSAFDLDAPTDPDATSFYDLRPAPSPRYAGRSPARRRQIRDTQQEIAGLRAAIAAGWDVGPELAHVERRLARLEAA